MARDTRLALLVAAQKSFAACGYGGTSVRQLARAAGIKESSLYNHFASKQELLEAVIERAETRLAAVAERFHVSFDDAEAAAPFYARVTPAQLKALLEAFLHEWLCAIGNGGLSIFTSGSDYAIDYSLCVCASICGCWWRHDNGHA